MTRRAACRRAASCEMACRLGIALLVALVVLAVAAIPAAAQLDATLARYELLSSTWADRAIGAAVPLFGALAILEIVISGYSMLAQDESPDRMIRRLAMKAVILLVLGAIFARPALVITPAVKGLEDVAIGVGGPAGITGDCGVKTTPGAILCNGVGMMQDIGSNFVPTRDKAFQTATDMGILYGWWAKIMPMVPGGDPVTSGWVMLITLLAELGPHLLDFMFLGFVMIGIFIAFAIIALQLFRTMLELYVATSAALFFLAFGGSRVTATLAEGVLAYIARVAVRFFFLRVIVGVGAHEFAYWKNLVNAAFTDVAGGNPEALLIWPNMGPLAELGVAVAAFAYVAAVIPGAVANALTGGIRFGVREGVAT